jgi:hypothetical protein
MSRAANAAYYLRRKAQRLLLAHNRAVLAQPALLTTRIQPLRRTLLRLKP